MSLCNCEFFFPPGSIIKQRKKPMLSLFRLYAVLIIWLSTMNMNGCYPIVASMRNNPLYMNCQLPRKSDCLLLLLLNGCLAKMDGSEELALFSSFLENSDIKRSFRNGVGSGIKISFRRAKP
ncbi:LOW QUALITY PROTEIN: neuropeptide S [Vipera latastei]